MLNHHTDQSVWEAYLLDHFFRPGLSTLLKGGLLHSQHVLHIAMITDVF